MKILILGGSGMLGHTFLQSLEKSHRVKCTLRSEIQSYNNAHYFNKENSIENIDVLDELGLEKVIEDFMPDVLVNCVGVTKQIINESKIMHSIYINSYLPHALKAICEKHSIRLILMSTDCVFSGNKGFYKEDDISDASDIYGKTKSLGEINTEGVLTLRKSTVGLEIYKKHGLIEWFLGQKKIVNGYSKAIYSGVTSKELANIVETIIIDYPNMSGLYNIASKPISKYKLLSDLNERLNNTLDIRSDDTVVCDRSLDPYRFERDTGIQVRDWELMLDELAEEIRLRKHDT
tara:strand:- start:6602 stop:7474 length:873 start_codon:yes stop_codon:yes gene_type:complete